MFKESEHPRDKIGQWTAGDASSAIKSAASDKKINTLTIEKIKKIKPEQFYKLEYLSKNNNEWKPMLSTDSPVTLKKSGYEIRYKAIYAHESDNFYHSGILK